MCCDTDTKVWKEATTSTSTICRVEGEFFFGCKEVSKESFASIFRLYFKHDKS